MTIKILTINVEISDQYGTSKDVLIGAFDDDKKLEAAIKYQKQKYRKHRNRVKVVEAKLNEQLGS